jgi:hypothetical protein
MDALVLENVLLVKGEGASSVSAADREKYLQQFQLD